MGVKKGIKNVSRFLPKTIKMRLPLNEMGKAAEGVYLGWGTRRFWFQLW